MMSKRREGLLHVTNVVLEGIYHEGMYHEAIFHKASPLLRRYFGCFMLVPVSVCICHQESLPESLLPAMMHNMPIHIPIQPCHRSAHTP